MLAVLSALLLLLSSRPAAGVFQKLYCSFSDSCECDFKPRVRDLEWDLYKNIFGQHLAQDIVSEEVARFLMNKSPDRPLVLSFHGSSGTGKTLVSTMLGNHLYGSAMSSPFVHQFVPTLHFPSAGRVDQYREELKSWVKGNLTDCARSVFIFDEMEKMPPGLIDVLEPFLGPSHVVFRTNYRKAIYLFISTAGQEVINKVVLENRLAGRDRDEIKLSDMQDALEQEVYNSKTRELWCGECRDLGCHIMASLGPIIVLDGRVTAKDYRTILEDHLNPVVQTLYPEGGVMYQDDNAPTHTARLKNIKVKLNISHGCKVTRSTYF